MIGLLLAALTFQGETKVDCQTRRTQMEMNVCSFEDYKRADAVLTRQWALTMANAKRWDKGIRLSSDKRPSHSKVLLESQRAWLRYRDQYCAFEGYWARGGSMESMLINGCMERMTKARTKELADGAKGLGE